MKTVTQSLVAAVTAFQSELYANTGYLPRAMAVTLDDAIFDRLAATVDVDSAEPHITRRAGDDRIDIIDLQLVGIRVSVRRGSARSDIRKVLRTLGGAA